MQSSQKTAELLTFLSPCSALPSKSLESGAKLLSVLSGGQVNPPGSAEDPRLKFLIAFTSLQIDSHRLEN